MWFVFYYVDIMQWTTMATIPSISVAFLLCDKSICKRNNLYLRTHILKFVDVFCSLQTHTHTHSCTHTLTHSLTHAHTHLLTHSLIHSLTCSVIHSFTTHSLTHSLTQKRRVHSCLLVFLNIFWMFFNY